MNRILQKIKKLRNKENPLHRSIRDLEKRGLLDHNDIKMIKNIVDLKEFTVKEIMVPRVDVTSISKDSKLEDILNMLSAKIFSRLPVYDEKIDNIIGILHTKDLLKSLSAPNGFILQNEFRPAFFVPETKYISTLLIELRERKSHMAIVVDEYGGMSGIITLEDIVEKIIGDIQDEFDNEIDDIITVSENTFIINPRLTIEEMNDQLATNLTVEEIDTLGGLMFMLFGKIPLKGEKVSYNNLNFTIESITGRNIKAIKLEIDTNNN